MIIVVNSSPLIALCKINRLKILKEQFDRTFISEGVYKEVVIQGKGKVGSKEVEEASWIQIKKIKDIEAKARLTMKFNLGDGEAETIVLAREIKADLIILDEGKGRDIASISNLKVRGTLAILARDCYMRNKPDEFLLLVEELKTKGFRISDSLYKKISSSNISN